MNQEWTSRENLILCDAHTQHVGSITSWSLIAMDRLPGRTQAACETQFGKLRKRTKVCLVRVPLCWSYAVERNEIRIT